MRKRVRLAEICQIFVTNNSGWCQIFAANVILRGRNLIFFFRHVTELKSSLINHERSLGFLSTEQILIRLGIHPGCTVFPIAMMDISGDLKTQPFEHTTKTLTRLGRFSC